MGAVSGDPKSARSKSPGRGGPGVVSADGEKLGSGAGDSFDGGTGIGMRNVRHCQKIRAMMVMTKVPRDIGLGYQTRKPRGWLVSAAS